MLAGQINYDNAVLLLLAALCLLAISVYDALKARRVDLRALLLCACICMVGSLVKYAFLPFAAGVVLFVAVVAARAFWGRYRQLLPAIAASWRQLSWPGQAGLVILAIIC